MAHILSEEINECIKSAENNLKKEVKEAKKRKDEHLIAVNNSSGSAKTSCFGSSTMNSISSSGSSVTEGIPKNNDLSLSASFTQLEDMEMPSSFNSSTVGLEEMLSISDESPKSILVSRKDGSLRKKSVRLIGEMLKDSREIFRINHLQNISKSLVVEECSSGATPDRWNSCNISGLNTFFLHAETEKVLEALEAEELGLKSQFLSPPSSRLTILDLGNLNDSLLSGTPNSNVSEDELQHVIKVPSMSTPKTAEKDEVEQLAINDCKVNLSFNGTFGDNSPSMKENTFVVDEEKLVMNHRNNVAVNTTFDKCVSSNVDKEKVRKLNITFEADTPKQNEDNMNRTFEVVGNGSFIIEGKCTNLMDMESEALGTVLGSATSTPISRGTRSYPDTKKLSRSTLKKRLSMLTSQAQDGSIPGSEKTDSLSCIPEQQGSKERPLPLGSLTKEQVLNRLRKNNPGSVINSGPMKAVPLSALVGSVGSVKQIDHLKRRAASTPTGEQSFVLQKGYLSETNNSEEKGKLPSLPSFGSVSSIGTDGINSREIGSDDFMATPEVFRHRSVGGPRITSTPTLVPSCLKFVSDLGLGSAPTPIVAPIKNSVEKVEESGNSSYVVEDSKRVKNKLNFTAPNDSVFFFKVNDCEKINSNLEPESKVSKEQKNLSEKATTSPEVELHNNSQKKELSFMKENFQEPNADELADELQNPKPVNVTENLQEPGLENSDEMLQNSGCMDKVEKLQNFDPDHTVNHDQDPIKVAVKLQDLDPDDLAENMLKSDLEYCAKTLQNYEHDDLAENMLKCDLEYCAEKLQNYEHDDLAENMLKSDLEYCAEKLQNYEHDDLAENMLKSDLEYCAEKLQNYEHDDLAENMLKSDLEYCAEKLQNYEHDDLAEKLHSHDFDYHAEKLKECDDDRHTEKLHETNRNDLIAPTVKEGIEILEGMILLEKDLILKPDEQETNGTKVFASTGEVEAFSTELKDPLKDSNLSSIKATDLTKELINTVSPIKELNEGYNTKVSVCCQCGSLKQSLDSGICSSDDNQTEYKANQVFKSKENKELDLLQDVTSKANEIIEAYEEMHKDEMQNLAAEFNEINVDLKSAVKSSKNEPLETTVIQSKIASGLTSSNKVKPKVDSLTRIQRTSLISKEIAFKGKKGTGSTTSTVDSSMKRSSTLPSKQLMIKPDNTREKLSSQQPLHKQLTSKSNLGVNGSLNSQQPSKHSTQRSFGESVKLSSPAPLKLTLRPSAPLKLTPRPSPAPLKLTPRPSAPLKLTPRSSVIRESLVKRQSLYKSTRLILKPVNSLNTSVTGAALRNKACRSEDTPQPILKPAPKSLPNIKASLYSKTLAEFKTLPSKALPKFTVPQTRTLPKSSSTNLVQPEAAKLKSLPSNLVPKASSSSIRKSTGNQSKLSHSSANKENASLKNPVRKSVVGSGIRPPSIRTSIPVPRNVK